ncbi:hypothetical protein [Microbacterium sp. UCD-TDU]|uniref:hypothetical protein n=1 Tax=Microbacterium sp. UCD-TDU TaxID=1247714 RepID=UPI000345921A|nr:hypothetical protein [Microbacterium sp. UCD-TDU]EYT60460.1 hypothetical protein D514_0105610 [Microbacterium sp. UCD-TDU]
MNTSESQNPENTSHPFGYWLKAADRLMAAEFATAFDSEHANRRDWRILNAVDGTVAPDRPLNTHKLHDLTERGWVATDGDGWALTDEGRAAKDRLGAIVDKIRAKVADAVPAEDMATTLASLEKIARAFGWDEETPLPRGRRHGFGGPRHGRGAPRGFGHRLRHDFGPGMEAESGCRHAHGHGHTHDHGHKTQHAFERGFDAGFTRGRAL